MNYRVRATNAATSLACASGTPVGAMVSSVLLVALVSGQLAIPPTSKLLCIGAIVGTLAAGSLRKRTFLSEGFTRRCGWYLLAGVVCGVSATIPGLLGRGPTIFSMPAAHAGGISWLFSGAVWAFLAVFLLSGLQRARRFRRNQGGLAVETFAKDGIRLSRSWILLVAALIVVQIATAPLYDPSLYPEQRYDLGISGIGRLVLWSFLGLFASFIGALVVKEEGNRRIVVMVLVVVAAVVLALEFWFRLSEARLGIPLP